MRVKCAEYGFLEEPVAEHSLRIELQADRPEGGQPRIVVLDLGVQVLDVEMVAPRLDLIGRHLAGWFSLFAVVSLCPAPPVAAASQMFRTDRLGLESSSSSLPSHMGFVFEWIQEIYPELVKIAHVSGHDRQPVHDGRRGDQGRPPSKCLTGDA